MTFEDLHYMYRNLSSEELLLRFNFVESFYNMLIADFLVVQRDRHGGNIEILIKDDDYYFAPLFDNGLSFLAPYPSSLTGSISSFESLKDYPVNNYIGTRSLYQNLGYLSHPVRVNKLTKEHRKSIFYNLKCTLPNEYLDKVWEIITYRYMFLRKRGFIVD